MAIVEVLKKTKLFEGFDADDFRALAEICQTRDLSRSQSLFTEGTKSTSLFVVAQGTIAIKKSGDKGDDHDVSKIGSGGHFGEMAMLTTEAEPEKRSTSAEAAELTQVVEISYDDFKAFLSSKPQRGLQVYKNIAVSLAGRIRKTTEDLAGLRALRLRST